MENKIIVKNRMKFLRELWNKSVLYMAKQCHMSWQKYKSFEDGRQKISLQEAEMIAYGFGMDINEIFYFEYDF